MDNKLDDIEILYFAICNQIGLYNSFLEDNKNTIFTLVEHRKGTENVLWEIEEDPRWLLYADYLTKVEKRSNLCK